MAGMKNMLMLKILFLAENAMFICGKCQDIFKSLHVECHSSPSFQCTIYTKEDAV